MYACNNATNTSIIAIKKAKRQAASNPIFKYKHQSNQTV